MLIQTLINTIFQLILFSIIPFVWWVISARNQEGFLSWVGLKRPAFDDKMKTVIILSISFTIMLAIGIYLITSFEDKSLLVASEFSGQGLNAILPIFISAVIKTGFCEELFFRGFLNKRFSHKFGFTAGNIIQAVIFGLLHGVLLMNAVPISTIALVVCFTATAGWFLGYVNEKLGNGSIIPSWIVHSLTNIIPSLLFLFGVITV